MQTDPRYVADPTQATYIQPNVKDGAINEDGAIEVLFAGCCCGEEEFAETVVGPTSISDEVTYTMF